MQLPCKITWADSLLATSVLLIAGCLCWLFLSQAPGRSVIVTTPENSYTLPLSHPVSTVFFGKDGHAVTIEIRNGKARVLTATCPDKVCVRSGVLSRSGQTAACVPAGIVLRISGETEVDAVAE